MQPLAAGRLDEGVQPLGLQRFSHRLGRRDDRFEIQPLVGIEVEGDLFGRLRIAGPTAPRVQLKPARLGDGDQPPDIDHGDIGFALMHVDQLQPWVRARHGVALEEGLALDPIGRADDRHRPVGDMGQYPFGRLFIVAGQVRLGDRRAAAGGGPQNLIRAGQGDAGDDHLVLARSARRRRGLLRLFRRRRLRLIDHLLSPLVLAQPLEGRMAQGAAFGQTTVLQLSHQNRPQPVDVLAAARRPLADEGRGLGRRRLQRGQQGLQQRGGIAGPDPAEVTQPLLLRHADQEGAKARPALRRPAADDDLIPAPAFGLDPGRGPARLIGGVQRLGDHPLQIHPAGAVQNGLAGGGEVIDIAHPPPRLGRDPVDQGLEPRLPVRQRQGRQIVPPFLQQVEGEIDQVLGLSVGDGGLKGGKVRRMVLGQGAQFAVHHPVGPLGRIGRQFRKAVGPVMAPTGVEPRAPAADGDLDAIAVELDLMHPAGPAGRMVRHLAQLDRLEGGGLGQVRLARLGLGRLGPLSRDGAGGGPLGLAFGDLRQAAAAGDGGVDLHIGVALAGHGRLVLLLDQQPVVAFGRLAAIGLQPHQGPAAAQPLAVQDHLQRAALQRRLYVGLLRLPFAAVPQLDGPGAVVAGRNGPLERPIGQGVVLHLHRQSFDRRIARRRLGDGPGLQDPVMFDAEVVMQPGRRMALDQIGQPALASGLGLSGRFGGAGEVALGPIGFQSVRHVAASPVFVPGRTTTCMGRIRSPGSPATVRRFRWPKRRLARRPIPTEEGRRRRRPRARPLQTPTGPSEAGPRPCRPCRSRPA